MTCYHYVLVYFTLVTLVQVLCSSKHQFVGNEIRSKSVAKLNGEFYMDFHNKQFTIRNKHEQILMVNFEENVGKRKPMVYSNDTTIKASWSDMTTTLTITAGRTITGLTKYSIELRTKLLSSIQVSVFPTGHIYGGAEQFYQRWPIENVSMPMKPYIGSEFYQAVQERYWLSSKKFAILVPDQIPLWLQQDGKTPTFTFKAQYANSVYANFVDDTKVKPILNFTIVTAPHNMTLKGFHKKVLTNYYSKPSGLPDLKMMRYPIWSTWVSYGQGVTQNKTVMLAKDIMQHNFSNCQIEIDNGWETVTGDETPDPIKFPNMTQMVETLLHMGFRTTLWVHQYVNCGTKTSHDSKVMSLMVKPCIKEPFTSGWMTGSPAWTPWWMGVGASVDVTNVESAKWWVSRLQNLTKTYGIHSFKFDAGEATWLGSCYRLKNAKYPNEYAHVFAQSAAQLGNGIEVRVGSKSQHLPIFVRILDRSAEWNYNTGLKSVIPTVLLFGILGYPFVLPDMVGGNGTPDEELFIRWTQVSTFMPSIQFSYPPWKISKRATRVAQKMMKIREEWFPYIHQIALESVKTGNPIIRPLWWIEESEQALTADSQFLVGDKLLVAPITDENARVRKVHIPNGTWASQIDGKIWKGPLTISQSVRLEDLAFYVKKE